jgi:hypothetical protein
MLSVWWDFASIEFWYATNDMKYWCIAFWILCKGRLNSNISDKLFMISRLWRIGSLQLKKANCKNQLDKRTFERTSYYIEETWYTLSWRLLQRIVSHALTIIPQINFPAITPTIHTLRERTQSSHPTTPPGEATHMNSLPTWFECFQKKPNHQQIFIRAYCSSG